MGRVSSPFDCSSHQNHTHGVGVTRAWTPAGQDDHNVPLLEEASDLAWKCNQKLFRKAVVKRMPRAQSCPVDNGCMRTLQQTPTHFHGEVHSHVNILRPHVIGWICVQDRENAAVQVGLASCLSVTGDGQDGSAGPVPGDQVCGPGGVKTRQSI